MTPKMSVDIKKAQNVCSQLLTEEENRKVFLALGKQCTVCIFILYVKFYGIFMLGANFGNTIFFCLQ